MDFWYGGGWEDWLGWLVTALLWSIVPHLACTDMAGRLVAALAPALLLRGVDSGTVRQDPGRLTLTGDSQRLWLQAELGWDEQAVLESQDCQQLYTVCILCVEGDSRGRGLGARLVSRAQQVARWVNRPSCDQPTDHLVTNQPTVL